MWLALPAALLVETMMLPLVVLAGDWGHEFSHLNLSLRGIAMAMFVAAGVLLIAAARILNQPRVAAFGIAYLTMALGDPLSWAIAPVHGTSAAEELDPLMRIVCSAVAMAIAYVATDPGRPGPRPTATVIASAVAITLSLGVLVTVHDLTHHPLDLSTAGYVSIQVLLGVGWLATARRARNVSIPLGDAEWAMAVVLPFALLGLADLVRTLAVVSQLTWLVTASALRVTAGAVAVGATMIILQRALAAEAAHRSSADRALAVVERLLADEEQSQSQHRHEARSIVSAIHLVWETLEKRGSRLPDETREHLRSASLHELDRLRELIDPAEGGALDAVRLIEVLAPLVAAQHRAGREVVLEVDDCVVQVHAADLQVVVQTLLAATAASNGSRLRLRACAGGDRVEIGIEAADESGQTSRTIEDPDDQGSPIGYFTCKRLMRRMGGTMSLEGIGRFVLVLPLSGSSQGVEHPVHVGDVPDVPAAGAGVLHPALVGQRRIDDSDQASRDAIRNAPAIDEGKVDDQGAGFAVVADLDAARTEHTRERVPQQGRPREHDGGEVGMWTSHTPIDPRAPEAGIPKKVELP